MTDSLRDYLADLWRLHAAGAAVAETSYYPPLHKLLTEIGQAFKPKVFCILHPKDKLPSGAMGMSMNKFQRRDTTLTFMPRLENAARKLAQKLRWSDPWPYSRIRAYRVR
jgi:hypothetical protein